jgi:hypothetical protein
LVHSDRYLKSWGGAMIMPLLIIIIITITHNHAYSVTSSHCCDRYYCYQRDLGYHCCISYSLWGPDCVFINDCLIATNAGLCNAITRGLLDGFSWNLVPTLCHWCLAYGLSHSWGVGMMVMLLQWSRAHAWWRHLVCKFPCTFQWKL